jgi:hypothetical protein
MLGNVLKQNKQKGTLTLRFQGPILTSESVPTKKKIKRTLKNVLK